MTANRLWSCLLVVGACGSHSLPAPASDDAPKAPVDTATTITDTKIVGALGGTAFTLQYGVVKRATTGDPRNWVCASNTAIVFANCETTTGVARTMLFGAFVYDNGGAPQWDTVETALVRTGSNPLTVYARKGSLEVLKDDTATGELQLTLSLDFGEIPTTTGSVAAVP